MVQTVTAAHPEGDEGTTPVPRSVGKSPGGQARLDVAGKKAWDQDTSSS